MVSPSAGGVPQLLEWLAERGHAPEFLEDAAVPGSPEWIEAFMAALRAFALDLDAHELFEGGQARHVPFGEVVGIPEVAVNPQHRARGFLRPVEHGGETVIVPGPLARFRGTPCPSPQPPPLTTPADAADVLARWSGALEQDGQGGPAGRPAAGESEAEDDPRPLAGVRIIDFSHVLAGPFATRILADLGADVIRVQTTVRAVGTAANDYPYSTMWGRSKRSITLDMRDERAVKVLRSLVEQADVVIENFSAGVLDDWGAGWAELSSWNDQVIYISMQGAGTDGPWREYVTFAPTVHALCGLTALSGPEGRVDCGPGVALNDHTSGLAAALSLLAALEARRRTGVGQHIDLSQFEVGTFLTGPAVLDYLANGREARAAGTRDAFADHVPSDVVPTAGGGWLAVTARDDDDWSRLAPLLGAPTEWASADTRRSHRSDVRRLLEQWAASRSAADAEAELQGHGVPASMVQDAATLTGDDPQLRHRDWELALESPIWGTQRTDRFPALVHDADGSPIELTYAHSPYFGEHTFEVYEQLLGLDMAEIAERMGDGLFS
jgi:crotonobetainyl-CoA:carnitine CoA-transferase CaiB-like acyl-CoA transferase